MTTTFGVTNFFEQFGRNDKSFSKPQISQEVVGIGYQITVGASALENIKFFNLAFALKSKPDSLPELILSLNDNTIDIWSLNANSGRFDLIASGIIPYTEDTLTIEIKRSANGACVVLMNSIAATAIDYCPARSHYIEKIETPNGTPAEQEVVVLVPSP